jgi:AcrR family transcriptional regulator
VEAIVTDSPVVTPTSPARPPADSGSARTRILEQSLALFSVRGFADVSMSEIASAVGITKAALYYHFSGKEELFAYAFANEVATVRDQITAIARRETDLYSTIYDLAILFLERGHRDMRRLHQDFVNFVSEQMRDEIFKDVTPENVLVETFTDFLARHAAEGHVRTDIEVGLMVPVIFGMVHAQVKLRERSRDADRSNDEIARSITEVVLYGIVPRNEH